MFEGIKRFFAQRKINRELDQAEKLAKSGYRKESKELATRILRSCRGVGYTKLAEGRCRAVLAENLRTEAMGLVGKTDARKLARCVPYYARATKLLQESLGLTIEVQCLILRHADMLNALKRFEEAIPLWELLLAQERNKKSHSLFHDYAVALHGTGRVDEALAALRRNVELEQAELQKEEFDGELNVDDLFGIDYFHGPFALAGLLVERKEYDEALGILIWILRWTERRGMMEDEFSPARDRVRQLMEVCLFGLGRARDGDGFQQQRLELVVKTPLTCVYGKPAFNHCEEVVLSVWQFYKDRNLEVRFFKLIEQFVPHLPAEVNARICILKAAMLASADQFDEALVAVHRAKIHAPSFSKSDLAGRELAILVLKDPAVSGTSAATIVANWLLGLAPPTEAATCPRRRPWRWSFGEAPKPSV